MSEFPAPDRPDAPQAHHSWGWHVLHPSGGAVNYMVAGVLTLVFCMMGVLLWTLVFQVQRLDAERSYNKEAVRIQQEMAEHIAARVRLDALIARRIGVPEGEIQSALEARKRDIPDPPAPVKGATPK